ncbi:monovalent cation/H+ antiporter subunit A [Ectothiorhodospiraceae bacterium BW-2]|nr:monovalent cation/H+ antiporter subunit A [Ectothiorhodospiraceae bacterium BW-2]
MISPSFSLPTVVLLPFIGAVVVAWLAGKNRIASAWGAGLFTLLALLQLLQLLEPVMAGQTLVQSWRWIDSIGLSFAFRLDGLALLFALLILVIGLLVILYARYYISSKDCMGRFYGYLLLFMGSMLGIVLSENLLQLVLFWELTSLSSFLLISYWQYRPDGRDGAKMALTVTGAGGLALLAGVLMLGHIVGSYQLSEVLVQRELIINHPLYTPMVVLILLGVFTKSAQFPFHFWLPHAMAAPTPVSAYLHSATMVKAGIFLLARFFPVLSGTPEWTVLVSTAGMATLLLGAFTALFQHDLKGLLAYSTISHLGLITLLFGFSTPLAAVAAIFHIINHATFKASLFMVAGIIDHETGTRDMRRLHGLWHYMPHTATLAMVAASAMAGVPLLNGFLSKEMFFERALTDSGIFNFMIPLLATLAGVFSVAYSLRFIHDVFFGGKNHHNLDRVPHEPPRFMKIPVDILVIACFAVGTLPFYTVAPLLAVAVTDALQAPPPDYSLSLWHGFTLPLLMSVIAFVGGIAIYFRRQRLFAWYERVVQPIDARVPYRALVESLFTLSQWLTSRVDRGSLQSMVATLMVTALIALGAGFLLYGDSPLWGERELLPFDWVALVALIILLTATAVTVHLHRQRFIALMTIGVVGLIVTLVFVRFSAPDLAMTQISVEVVTVVLILLALYYLPQSCLPHESSRLRVWRDWLLSIACGVGVFILTMAVLTREVDSIGSYFLENALPGGGGTNVVNVILVDFRGFDTLGEITVLGLAGLGIFAMLQGLRLYAPQQNEEGLPWSHVMHPPMMKILTRLILPLMLLVAVYIFLRGHNLPGGGFIAGLIAAVSLIVQYLVNGIEWTSARLRFEKDGLIALGLLIATVTGVVSMALGYPFLTSAFSYLHWPVVGKFEIASAMAFDLGVFLVVVGATVLILVELGKLSLQSQRYSAALQSSASEEE